MTAATEVPVWVKTQRGYERGFVNSLECLTSRADDTAAHHSEPLVPVILSDGNVVESTAANIFPSDTHFGHRDNASLTYLNAPNLLENIARRYEDAYENELNHEKIYARLNYYLGKSLSAVPPHPFAAAEAAYNALLKYWKSQSIIISGESGSGKTECSKHVLKYLAFISDKRHDSKNQGIESRVLQTNPILEAFGNAKTVHNENSSRFGKLMKLHFDRKGRMLGASIRTYLLAKSRVCHVPPRERNYHIFHWMCRGALQQDRDEWLVRPLEYYRYLDTEASAEGATQLQEVRTALESVGLPMATKQRDVFRVLSAILMLGNLTFTTGTRVDGVPNVTILQHTTTAIENVPPPSQKPFPIDDVEVIYELLGLKTPTDQQEFELVVTSKKIRDSRSNLTELQAKQTVDALARSLYQLVFDFLVRRINIALSHRRSSTSSASRSERELAANEESTPSNEPERDKINRYIGVLDIFGFENLTPYSANGFEQLCINYANERLHQFFLSEVVLKEQQLYSKEGLFPPETAFVDNIDVCYMIAGKPKQTGIFGLLDEASLIPVVGSKDDFFCNKVNTLLTTDLRISTDGDSHRRSTSAGCIRSRGTFVVKHFAGDVTYTATGFCERNVDNISNDIKDFLLTNCGSFISQELCYPLRVGGQGQTSRSSENEALCHKCGVKMQNVASQRMTVDHSAGDDGLHRTLKLAWGRTSERPPLARPAVVSSTPVLCTSCQEEQTLLGDDSSSEDNEDGSEGPDELDSNLRRQSRAHEWTSGGSQNRASSTASALSPQLPPPAPDALRRSRARSVSSQRKSRDLKSKTLASLFSLQVDGLMRTLERTSSMFVRCIKPNDKQQPKVFQRNRVLRQLETGGMVGVLELMTKGFPCRVPYMDLWERYATVLPEAMRTQITPKDFTEIILLFLNTRSTDYRIGHTRAFFRFGTLAALESISSITDPALQKEIVAKTFVLWLHRKKQRVFSTVRCSVNLWLSVIRQRCRRVAYEAQAYYETVYLVRKMNRASLVIQKRWKGWVARQVYAQLRLRRQAAEKIQKVWRGYSVYSSYQHFRFSVVYIQNWWKAELVRRRYREICCAAEVLQGTASCTLIRRHYVDALQQWFAAVRIQTYWRRQRHRLQEQQHIARKEMSAPSSLQRRERPEGSNATDGMSEAACSSGSTKRRRLLGGSFAVGDSTGAEIPRLALEQVSTKSATSSPERATPRFPREGHRKAEVASAATPPGGPSTEIRSGLRGNIAKDLDRFSVTGCGNCAPVVPALVVPPDARTTTAESIHESDSSMKWDTATGLPSTSHEQPFYTPREPPPSPPFQPSSGIFGEFVDGRWVALDAATIAERLQNSSDRHHNRVLSSPQCSHAGQPQRPTPMYKPWLVPENASHSAPETPTLYETHHQRSTLDPNYLRKQTPLKEKILLPPASSSPDGPSKLFQLPQFKQAVLNVVLDELDATSREQVIERLRSRRVASGPIEHSDPYDEEVAETVLAPAKQFHDNDSARQFQRDKQYRRASGSLVSSTGTPVPQTVSSAARHYHHDYHDTMPGQFSQEYLHSREFPHGRRVSWLNFGPDDVMATTQWRSRPSVARQQFDNELETEEEEFTSPLIELRRRQQQQCAAAALMSQRRDSTSSSVGVLQADREHPNVKDGAGFSEYTSLLPASGRTRLWPEDPMIAEGVRDYSAAERGDCENELASTVPASTTALGLSSDRRRHVPLAQGPRGPPIATRAPGVTATTAWTALPPRGSRIPRLSSAQRLGGRQMPDQMSQPALDYGSTSRNSDYGGGGCRTSFGSSRRQVSTESWSQDGWGQEKCQGPIPTHPPVLPRSSSSAYAPSPVRYQHWGQEKYQGPIPTHPPALPRSSSSAYAPSPVRYQHRRGSQSGLVQGMSAKLFRPGRSPDIPVHGGGQLPRRNDWSDGFQPMSSYRQTPSRY